MKKPFKTVLVTALSTIIATLPIAGQSTFAASDQNDNSQRAIESYQAMQKYYYDGQHNLYSETYPASGNPYSYLWQYNEAFSATVDMLAVPKVGSEYALDTTKRMDGLQAYLDPNGLAYQSYVVAPLGSGGDKFFDDNAVVGLSLVHNYQLSKNEEALKRAIACFKYDVSGWDNDPTHKDPGGDYWSDTTWNNIKATNVTSLSAELGLHLYQITGDKYYLDWSKKMYDWVNMYMQAPNGLYWNSVDFQGNIDINFWSYNQGAMIGDSVLLYAITHDKWYLEKAESISDASLQYYGTDGRLYQQPDIFNGMMFTNMLMLEDFNHNNKYRKAMQDYADYLWTNGRDPQTGIITGGSNPADLLYQAAAVKIFSTLAAKKVPYNMYDNG